MEHLQTSQHDDQNLRVRNFKRGVQDSLDNFILAFNKRYITSWYHTYIAKRLERLTYEKDQRIVILLPPRHGKSLIASENFPAYYFGKSYLESDELKDIILLSYSDGFARDFGRKARNIMQTAEFKFFFDGLSVSEDQRSADKWESTIGQRFKSVGRSGQATGRGAHMLIIDDLLKNQEEADSPIVKDKVWELLKTTIYTRLEEGANIVAVNTRWCEDDPVGRMLDEWSHENWEEIILPIQADENITIGDHIFKENEILWPSRYNQERIERIKKALGFAFHTIFMQRPTVKEGQIFKYEYFKYYKEIPTKDIILKIQSWDTAHDVKTQNDFSVCTTWIETNNGYYLIDLFRQRLQFPELKKQATILFNEHKPDFVLIEQKASGISLTQELRRGTQIKIKKVVPVVDKVVRANAISPIFENGEAFFPDPDTFPDIRWLAPLIAELTGFPKSAKDDQVDSITQALKFLAGAIGKAQVRAL